MNKEKLLEEAKRRYPLGTKQIASAWSGSICSHKCIGEYIEDYKGHEIIWNIQQYGGNGGWLYNNGIWAKNLSKLERKIIHKLKLE